MFRLTFSISLSSIDEAKAIITWVGGLPASTQVSLTEEGSRSGGNLLLPKVPGRTGEHLQTKKANLEELKNTLPNN